MLVRLDCLATTGLIFELALGLVFALTAERLEVLITLADALEFELLETFLGLELDCFWVLVLVLADVAAKAMGEVITVIEAARISETQIFLLNTIILVLF